MALLDEILSGLSNNRTPLILRFAGLVK